MKKQRQLLALLILILASPACTQKTAPGPAGADPALYATLYMQKASEYRALCYQAFNLARYRLDQELAGELEKPLAVIVDVDETVLDNSPYQAQAILEQYSYPVKWDDWMWKAGAHAIPGSVEFLNYARDQGVKVFYVTNRKEEYREPTLKNLAEEGFPFAENEYLLMRTTTSSKDARREQVLSDYRVVLYMGDNLGDFSSGFDTDDISQRTSLTDADAQRFGRDFIVLPNPVYGQWLTVLQASLEEGAGLEGELEGF